MSLSIKQIKIGQLVRVTMKREDSSVYWLYGYVQNIFDGEVIIYKADGSLTADTNHDDEKLSKALDEQKNPILRITYCFKHGLHVMAKRKTYFFGLIKGEYLPQPKY